MHVTTKAPHKKGRIRSYARTLGDITAAYLNREGDALLLFIVPHRWQARARSLPSWARILTGGALLVAEVALLVALLG